MRFLALAVLAGALVALLQVERRNRRNASQPWWARDYGRMDRDWVKRQMR